MFWNHAVSNLVYRCHSRGLGELIGTMVQVGLHEVEVVGMMAIVAEGIAPISGRDVEMCHSFGQGIKIHLIG